MATRIGDTYYFTLDEIGRGGGGGGGSDDAVLYTPQTLSPSEQTQARTNIGAGTYSKPGTGIPADDLAESVTNILTSSISYAELEGYTEEWEFTMADGSTVIKKPVVLPNEA